MREGIEVAVLRQTEQLLALRSEWNALLQQSALDTIFLTWEWQTAWWRHFREQRSLALYTVRCDGELVAIAPFAERPASLAAEPILQTLELMGTGIAGSDYLDIIVRPDFEDVALSALAERLERETRVISLQRLPANGGVARGLLQRLEKHEWDWVELAGEKAPFVCLHGRSWEDYLASLSGQHRATFRRKLRRLEQQFRVELKSADSEAEVTSCLGHLFELHRQRWGPRGISEFASGKSWRFHCEMAEAARLRGWLRLYILTLDGEPAAALYGFHYGRTFSFFQSGFAPAFARHSVGMVTMGLSIRRALEEGAHEYDMLHGVEAYKFHWAAQVHDLSRLEAYPPGVRGMLLRGAVDATRALRKVARTLRVEKSAA